MRTRSILILILVAMAIIAISPISNAVVYPVGWNDPYLPPHSSAILDAPFNVVWGQHDPFDPSSPNTYVGDNIYTAVFTENCNSNYPGPVYASYNWDSPGATCGSYNTAPGYETRGGSGTYGGAKYLPGDGQTPTVTQHGKYTFYQSITYTMVDPPFTDNIGQISNWKFWAS